MFNLRDIPESGSKSFTPVPEDRYNLLAEEAKFKTTSTGKQAIEVTYVIQDGKYKGRKMWHTYTLTPKALKIVKLVLQAMGSKIAEDPNVTGDQLAQEISGKTVNYLVTVGESNTGKQRNELDVWTVKAVEKAGSAVTDAPKVGTADLFR